MKKLVRENIDDEIRFTNRPGPLSQHYNLDKNGEIISQKSIQDKKEEEKEQKAEMARQRLLHNSAFLLKVPATKAGVEEIKNWVDEEGEGFSDRDYIIRTMHGEADLVAYEDIGNADIINDLKTDYKLGNDIKYIMTRPILYKNWLKLPLYKQIASYDPERVGYEKPLDDIIGKHD